MPPLWVWYFYLPLGSVLFGSLLAVPVWLAVWLSIIIVGGVVSAVGVVTQACVCVFGSHLAIEKALELRFHHAAEDTAKTVIKRAVG